MATKQRELPSWMNEKKKDCVPKNLKTKKKAIPRATVYFMNEWELVQSALIFGDQYQGLGKVSKLEDSSKEGRQEAVINPPEQNAHNVRTRVSEAHLDTSEQETLCYSSNRQECASDNEHCAASTLPHHAPDADGDAEHTSGKEHCASSTSPHHASDAICDDDALKLVREIFFT